MFRIFSIVLHISKFHEDVNYLKDMLQKSSFPTTIVDKCIIIFLNKQLEHKIIEHTAPKRNYL